MVRRFSENFDSSTDKYEHREEKCFVVIIEQTMRGKDEYKF